MTRRLTFWLALLLAASCAQTPEAPNPGGPAVCEDGPRNPSATVDREVAIIGNTLSALRRVGDSILIVESGDNTISRFTPATGEYELLVDVGNERGPWDVFEANGELWISNYVGNSVTVADAKTGEVLDEIEHPSFDGPSGIAVLGDRAYVGNVQFTADGYGPGTVTVINRVTREVFGTIATKRQNPQAIDVVDERLVVIDSGAFGHDGSFKVGSEAAVEVWEPTHDALIPEISVALLPLVDDLAIGVPGRPAHQPGSDIIYLPSAVGPVVFAFNVKTREWVRGSDNPIRLYDTDANALHHASMGDDGILYVTAFNEDRLYLVDTSCDAVLDSVDLESSSMLAGAHGVIPFGNEAYFALDFAHELGRVRFDFGD